MGIVASYGSHRLSQHLIYWAFILQNILAELLMEYPHQCLWQSIAVYRSDQKKQQLRFTRCRTVYDIAKRKDRSGQLQILICQYEYAAAAFIKLAYITSFMPFLKIFNHLGNNLLYNYMSLSKFQGGRRCVSCRITLTIQPKISLHCQLFQDWHHGSNS